MANDHRNGLNVGDVIRNKYREGLFLITLFGFERISTNPTEDHPYIIAHEIIVDESGIEIVDKDLMVSVFGSERLTREHVVQMIREHVKASNEKLLALQELADMAE